ncbi:MAG: ATPase [Deltaproteobacteria bacterium RBG_16_71_12]|nr:MAG: ATPase [Deltaproteobacteria bacterium RBG_16_71_12]
MSEPTEPFADLDDVERRLRAVGYLPDRRIATAAFLAARLERPLLVEGPAGVGKTELARALAEAQGRELIRLQCYEGIDESRALYDWEYGKQLLYTQLLKDHLAELVGAANLDDAVEKLAATDTLFFSERFLVARPLLHAIRAERPALLLVDEIDKADPEMEALLLEVLADFAITIPEIGTLKATRQPQVVLTSNSARELSDPLRRRCLHLVISFPDRERELSIVRARVPGIDEALARAVVGAVHKLRALDLRKPPSISEVIDWARALGVLGRSVIDEGTLRQTMGVLIKHKDDLEAADKRVADVVRAATDNV